MDLRHRKDFRWSAFLGHTSRELLARFFHRHEPFRHMDFGGEVSEWQTTITDIIDRLGREGWKVQDTVESVNDLNAHRALRYVRQAVADVGLEIDANARPHDVAMLLYLDHSSRFWECVSLANMEAIERWSDFIGREAREPDLSEATRAALNEALSAYFTNQATGAAARACSTGRASTSTASCPSRIACSPARSTRTAGARRSSAAAPCIAR